MGAGPSFRVAGGWAGHEHDIHSFPPSARSVAIRSRRSLSFPLRSEKSYSISDPLASTSSSQSPTLPQKAREGWGNPKFGIRESIRKVGPAPLCFLVLAVMTIPSIPYRHDVVFPQEHIAGGGGNRDRLRSGGFSHCVSLDSSGTDYLPSSASS